MHYRRVRTRHKEGIEYDIEDTNACPVKWLASRYMTAGSFARNTKSLSVQGIRDVTKDR